MDFMDFSRRLYRWASEGVDMYDGGFSRPSIKPVSVFSRVFQALNLFFSPNTTD